MKIKIGDKVYLQKYDVAYILQELDEVPASIFQEVFSNGKSFFICGDESDGFYFEKIFKDPSSVKWLMEQDWLIDYDEYADTPLCDLEDIHASLKDNYRSAMINLNSHNHEYRARHYSKKIAKWDNLAHKIISIEYFIAFRKGKIKFWFPPEYHGKTIYNTPSEKKSNFFKRLFGRKN